MTAQTVPVHNGYENAEVCAGTEGGGGIVSDKVTREQALACVQALVGQHGSQGPVPNSLGAWFHFEAALGFDELHLRGQGR